VRWLDIEPARLRRAAAARRARARHEAVPGEHAAAGKLAAFAALRRPIAAICHGVLLLARARDPASGRSLLHGGARTCLPKVHGGAGLRPELLEARPLLPHLSAYVEDEVRAALAAPGISCAVRSRSARAAAQRRSRRLRVRGRRLLSARWPGDAYLFARKLLARCRA
jgi:putative intracellular protease/amidase